MPITQLNSAKTILESSFKTLFLFLLMVSLISIASYMLTQGGLLPDLGVQPLVMAFLIAAVLSFLGFSYWSLWLYLLQKKYFTQSEVLNQEFKRVVGSSNRPKDKAYIFKRIGQERKELDSHYQSVLGFKRKTVKPVMFLAVFWSVSASIAYFSALPLFL
ncbi:hypothetical protein [Kangiella sp. HZ709]|uniref:hypothetical protein n=1 Tax=Kangiella sp. HZ709 TaxID=2666328 RepID=UPI0012B14E08|nr:hypothetical protein [Kangiella sp. HZ709]MRX28392.1 hypothetical protein [Kangiella sp. HZ709]